MAKIKNKNKVYFALFLYLVIIVSIVSCISSLKNIFINKFVNAEVVTTTSIATTTPPVKKVTHVTVPESVKALYMSAWVASSNETRQTLLNTLESSGANALVIDIKDYTGKIAFTPNSKELLDVGCHENKIRDLDAFIEELHKKNIYVIGRVAVFQDPCLVTKEPEDAVKNSAGGAWKDRKGLTWIDASNKNSWPYFAEIAREAYARGFDEVNFDYIRFPTDGNMEDMRFSGLASSTKAFVIRDFFKYLDLNLREGMGANYSTNIGTSTPYATSTLGSKIYNIKEFNAPKNRMMISADVFGLVTEATDDMGIGQHFESLLPYVDYLSPMVYPSHYANGYGGIAKPATEPYKVVYRAMNSAVERARKMGQDPLKLRPWLQDFNLGATYTPEMVKSQIKATYDAGLSGFFLWDPANKYRSGSVALGG